MSPTIYNASTTTFHPQYIIRHPQHVTHNMSPTIYNTSPTTGNPRGETPGRLTGKKTAGTNPWSGPFGPCPCTLQPWPTVGVHRFRCVVLLPETEPPSGDGDTRTSRRLRTLPRGPRPQAIAGERQNATVQTLEPPTNQVIHNTSPTMYNTLPTTCLPQYIQRHPQYITRPPQHVTHNI